MKAFIFNHAYNKSFIYDSDGIHCLKTIQMPECKEVKREQKYGVLTAYSKFGQDV